MFKILYICTANRIRSPLAVAFTRRAADDLPLEVASAGIAAAAGLGAMDEARAVARASGLDLDAHRCVPIADAGARGFDLVLCFEFQHMAAAVVGGGAPPDKTFLIKEFLRCAPTDPIAAEGQKGRARAVVAAANEKRRGAGFQPGEDVADPVGLPAKKMEAVAAEVEALCKEVVKTLFG